MWIWAEKKQIGKINFYVFIHYQTDSNIYTIFIVLAIFSTFEYDLFQGMNSLIQNHLSACCVISYIQERRT